jgi:hypothetical protein
MRVDQPLRFTGSLSIGPLGVLAVLALLLSACQTDPPDAAPEEVHAEPAEVEAEPAEVHADPGEVSARDAFWAHISEPCGQAFSGGLTQEPPGDDMLTGTEELIAHFLTCDEEEVRIAFHIELEDEESWDRSRTWVFRKVEDGLELRHDHREADGTPSEQTMYGGFTETEGTATSQDFVSVARTEESGYARGWRVEIVPGERYTYGTTRRGDWSWRVDFDLSAPVEEPPLPWGAEPSA